MEYVSEVKRIGGSAYLRLPPMLVKNYGFKDKSEVLLREADRLVVLDTKITKLDEAAKEILAIMKKGLDIDYKITREEMYETDRH